MLQVGWKYFPFNEVSINIPNLDNSLKGVKILQLSDLHLTKKVNLKYLNTLVEKINALEVDLVVFTGDLIQTAAINIQVQLATFSKLLAPCYFVSGNHEMVYGYKALETELQKLGIKCLDNQKEIIYINNTALQLVGLSDRYGFVRGVKRDYKKLFSSLDEDLTTILLAHQPKDVKLTKGYKIDLQLSGHTHGGQIAPFTKIVKIFQPFFAGLYKHEGTQLFVTRGLGYWGVSIRYKSAPEIPVFTIS